MPELQEVKKGLQQVIGLDAGAIEWLIACVLEALARDEPVGPAALTFLLGCYAATDREDIGEALGRALAAALEPSPAVNRPAEHAAWTAVFAEATRFSDDPRVGDAAGRGVEQLRTGWTAEGGTPQAIEACLVAVPAVALPDLLGATISELERLIAARYEPGQGMGALDDQISTASALLTAYALTGRVPYSMLADELMQVALRTSWTTRPFAFNCEAALVCGRLAALHRDDAYRQLAVTSTRGDYAEVAARVLVSQAPRVPALGTAAAPYGLALAQWLKLQ